MKLSTLFRLEENLHLDKKTLVSLRWIAIVGQLIAINFVYFYLKLELPIGAVHGIVLVGLITNLILQFKIKENQLKDLYSGFFLIYDLLQLTFLLYLTGGILPRMYDFLLASEFGHSFTNKGRTSPYLHQIPIYLCTAEQPGLQGAAIALQKTP